MQIFARRAIDVARQAAVVAAAEGWLIEREADAHGAGPRPVGVPSGACASIVVSGGELRGPAVLMLAVRGEGDERGDWALVGIVSDHVPRTLPPPRLASMRGVRSRGLVARLIEHPALGTLDDILTRRGTLEAGEAATILIAVARGLADLHECGRAGVVLTPRCVGLREDGCPVLTGLDQLRSLDHAVAREDLVAYAALTERVCAAVSGERGASLFAAATAGGHRSWDDVIRAVLRTADPIAVAWGHAQEDAVVTPHSASAAAVASAGEGVAPTPVPSDGSWELEATVRRDDVRPVVSSVPDASGRSPDPSGSVPDAYGRVPDDDGWAPDSSGRSPDDRGNAPGPPGRRDAVTHSLAVREVGPSPGGRPPAAPETAAGSGRAVAGGNGRALTAADRVLEAVGDRPVARVVGFVRGWAAARPLLVAIAVAPVVGVLLALMLFPAEEAGSDGRSDGLGESGPALLRESGTGPDGNAG